MLDDYQLELFGQHLRDKYGIAQPFADEDEDDN
jgi:hypothetical protein